MSTNNFKFENILIVLPDFNFHHDCILSECDVEKAEDCPHYQETGDFDEWAYDDYVSEMQAGLEKMGFESCDKWDNDRNYSGKIIASWYIYDKNEELLEINVIIRNGYYSGANIDYEIIDDYGFEKTNTLENKIDSKIRRLEKFLRKNGTELLKVGQFSNGEAVYKIKGK